MNFLSLYLSISISLSLYSDLRAAVEPARGSCLQTKVPLHVRLVRVWRGAKEDETFSLKRPNLEIWIRCGWRRSLNRTAHFRIRVGSFCLSSVSRLVVGLDFLCLGLMVH